MNSQPTAFSRTFSHDSTTFATDPRVVGSVTRLAPVEYLHKGKIIFLKSHIIPQILQLAFVLPFSNVLLNELVDRCFSFLWSKKA